VISCHTTAKKPSSPSDRNICARRQGIRPSYPVILLVTKQIRDTIFIAITPGNHGRTVAMTFHTEYDSWLLKH